MKMKKNYFETRSIRTRKTLVENKTVPNKNLSLTQNWFLPFITEAAPEIERNKTK